MDEKKINNKDIKYLTNFKFILSRFVERDKTPQNEISKNNFIFIFN